jgi:SAM-dependent methyltransferase
MSELDKEIVRNFWRSKSNQKSNRWTGIDFLDYEVKFIGDLLKSAPPSISILDLGSGAGELSKRIQRDNDRLTAVDYEKNFGRFFNATQNQHFIQEDVTNYKSYLKFDLILLFGVVIYLTKSEERKIYEVILNCLAKGGTAVIKHQVSLNEEVCINSFSEELKTDYSARYPSRLETEVTLKSVFSHVEPLSYPNKFNRFENMKNIAYFVH